MESRKKESQLHNHSEKNIYQENSNTERKTRKEYQMWLQKGLEGKTICTLILRPFVYDEKPWYLNQSRNKDKNKKKDLCM